MATAKILIEGYTSNETEERSCSTITLIKDGDLNMIVDPGTVSDPQILIDALAKENLSISDIDIIGLTHAHTDHNRNVGMFPYAKVLDYWGWWEGDLCTDAGKKITDNIQILKTPGHSDDSITFLVRTDEGIVAICGDVFWKEDFPEKDPYANNPEQLIKSRELVIEKADWIIPGHGKAFLTK
jgi:glyoxylase-like metal-dependent hydrolase (beta-lactamase superfamily II)